MIPRMVLHIATAVGLLPGVASAESLHWGSNPAFTVSVLPGVGEEWARLRVTNAQTAMRTTEEGYLEIDGAVVIVTVESQRGALPDRVIISPPIGLMAEPQDFWIEERETIVVILRPVPMW